MIHQVRWARGGGPRRRSLLACCLCWMMDVEASPTWLVAEGEGGRRCCCRRNGLAWPDGARSFSTHLLQKLLPPYLLIIIKFHPLVSPLVHSGPYKCSTD